MTDIHSKQTRSYNMSRIKGKDTKPEILVRKYLFSYGFRFRLHDPGLSGKPDIVLKKYKSLIFVNGCFWHGHNCKYASIPKTRTEWWRTKIESTKKRDSNNYFILQKNKWNVIVVWECQLRRNKLETTMKKIIENLISQIQY